MTTLLHATLSRIRSLYLASAARLHTWRAHLLRLILLGGVAVLVSGSSCSLKDAIREANDTVRDSTTDVVAVIEDSITQVDHNSQDWQNIVQGAIDKLRGQSDNVVAKLDLIMSRTVSAAGAETRCTADFLGQRVKEQLQYILAELKHQPLPPLRPHVCTTVPDNIAAAQVPSPVTHIGFYGYNFDLRSELKAFVEKANGSKTNVTSKMNTPSHYSMTLPFGTNGVAIGPDDQRIIVTWMDAQLVTVGITQPPPRQCEMREISFVPQPITFIPSGGRRGDKEFSGNGPRVEGYAMLLTTHYTTPNSVNVAKVRVYMRAEETKSDWTTVSGQDDFTVYTFSPGFRFWQRLAPAVLKSEFKYTDSDTSNDTFYPGEGPVQKFVVTGDTSGGDVGDTKVVVHFNQIRFQMREIGDCI